MKKRQMPICGKCYSVISDAYPTKILANMKDKDRCGFCGRLCYGYIVEIGDGNETDNTRRPANFTKEVP